VPLAPGPVLEQTSGAAALGGRALFFPVEDWPLMLALLVQLDFSCCLCGHAIHVTLRCEGQGLAENPLTTVTLECPTCEGHNQIEFTPEDGQLHRVRREREYEAVPEPSWN
jgi:hypothetical protein